MGLATVSRLDGWEALTAAHRALIEEAGRAGFFRSLAWFRTLTATSLDPGDRVALYTAGDPPAVILPMRRAGGRSPLHPRVATSLANFYSCEWAPLGRAIEAWQIAAIAAALRRERPAIDIVNLSSLPYPGDLFETVAQGFAEAGWRTQRYFHFGTWYEPTDGVGAEAYLAARPPALRNTIRRKTAALMRRGDARVTLIAGTPDLEPARLDAAIADYERVYRASWKRAEPYPAFAAGFIRAAAETGALRLGLVHVGDTPVAAQIWTVWNRHATLAKLAHDDRVKALSAGSVLTWHVMRHLLAVDQVAEIDFGRGDDDYKRLWMSRRREHWGLYAFNPGTLRGRLAALRHIGGRRAATLARRARAALTTRRR